jgi:cation diffusion facilitator family transporter
MGHSHSSKISIYGAMAANIAIAIAKFIGAAISGSSAMLSEGIHSIVDSANGLLLLYGIRRSQAEPDDNHPLGHGQELYFWSLMVAVLIFALGGGLSIYEGIDSFYESESGSHGLVSYVVLASAALFEGTALFISIREFNKNYPRDNVGFWTALRTSKDPGAFMVIVEDSAALIGLVIAFAGILLSQLLDNKIYDGVASILIGLLLTVVATALVAKTKNLLVGESASPETRQSIEDLVKSDAAVAAMEPPITLHLGPRDVMLAMNIEFLDALSADDIEVAIRRIETTIRQQHTEVKRIFIEAASIQSSQTEPVATEGSHP